MTNNTHNLTGIESKIVYFIDVCSMRWRKTDKRGKLKWSS